MVVAATRRQWIQFLVSEVVATFGVFAVFLVVERVFLSDAPSATLTAVGVVRGLTTVLVAIAVAAFYMNRVILDARSTAACWFRFLDGLPAAVFVLDRNGHPVMANQRSTELLGKGIMPDVEATELATAYPCYRMGTDNLYPEAEMPIVQALSGQQGYADDLELDREGKRVPLDVWAAPILDAQGNVEYAVAVFFDATARRQYEEAHTLRAREEEQFRQVQEFQRRQQEFINHAAHQLYTPLTPLRLQVEAVRKQVDDKTADRLARNVDRLRVLATQVLRVAKSQQLSQKAKFKDCSLQGIFDQALEMLQDQIKNRSIRLEAVSTDLIVRCDADLMAEAVYHGLHNAIKFSDEGQVVTLAATEDEGYITIEITDDGGGLTGEDDLFEPFKQGASDELDHHGWGLGLYLSKSIVEQHNGRIELVPDPDGQGAALRLTVPKDGPPSLDVGS